MMALDFPRDLTDNQGSETPVRLRAGGRFLFLE